MLERCPGPLEPPTPVKTGALERSPGPLEPPTLVKTGALERCPGPLESKTEALEPPAPVKTGALEPYPVWVFKKFKKGEVWGGCGGLGSLFVPYLAL